MVVALSAGPLLLFNGRIAGMSGIVGRLFGGHEALVNGAFVIGLLAGPVLCAAAYGARPVMTTAASEPVVILAGSGARGPNDGPDARPAVRRGDDRRQAAA